MPTQSADSLFPNLLAQAPARNRILGVGTANAKGHRVLSETVRAAEGRERFSNVLGYHVQKPERVGAQPPAIRRRVMDFGYALHSPVDWVDCV